MKLPETYAQSATSSHAFTNNMPQNTNFVNRENQENNDRTTFSMEDDDLDSAETYTYEHLTAQPDMQIVQVGDLSDFLKNGKIDRGAVRNAGLENAARVGRMLSDNIASVQNRYTGRDIQISGASIRHGLDGSFVRVSVNSKLGSVIGELAKTAIPVNSMLPNDLNIEYTYPMAAWATDGTNEYLALLHVDRYGENVKNIELLDVVHSLNGRIRKNSTTAAMPTRSADLSAPSNAVSKVSIADVLELVKDLHPDVLSNDVLEHFGIEHRPEGYYNGQVKFSLDDIADADVERLQRDNSKLTKAVRKKSRLYHKLCLDSADCGWYYTHRL